MIKTSNPLLRIQASGEYNKYQINIIEEAINLGLDYKYLLDSSLDLASMTEILIGLKKGLEVSIYASSYFDYGQMMEIRKGLEKGNNILLLIDPNWASREMQQIRIAMEKKLPKRMLNILANPEYNFKQIQEIRLAMEEGKDYKEMLDSNLTYLDMQKIRKDQ